MLQPRPPKTTDTILNFDSRRFEGYHVRIPENDQVFKKTKPPYIISDCINTCFEGNSMVSALFDVDRV